MLFDAMTGEAGAARSPSCSRSPPTLEKEKKKKKKKNKVRRGRRAERTKLLELWSPLATKNLGFVTTAGIPSHKPAERAAACVSSRREK